MLSEKSTFDDYPNLDSATLELISELAGDDETDLFSMDLSEARAVAKGYFKFLSSRWESHKISARAYQIPDGVGEIYHYKNPNVSSTSPVIIWLHGGGWMLGSAKDHSAWAKEIVSNSHCDFFDIDYPLAPENDYDKIIAVTKRTIEYCTTLIGSDRPVVIGGESAGATLALLLSEYNPQAASVIAVNPATDLRQIPNYKSRKQFDDQRIMQSWREIDLFIQRFVQNNEREKASPICNALSPPNLQLLVGEYDLFHDECVDYHKKLISKGEKSHLHIIPGGIHNSMEFGPCNTPGRAFFEVISQCINQLSGSTKQS